MSKASKKTGARAKPAQKEKRNGPGWFTVLGFSVMSFVTGVATATVALGSAETLNEFHSKNVRVAAEPPPLELVSFDDPKKNRKPEWFPETNRVDWSISLRPGVPTIPVRIDNLAKGENHRVLFQVLNEDEEPQLAAVLFVRMNGRAVVQLPPADYRIDVVSTPTDMPWGIAKDQYASPRLKLDIESKRSSIIAQKHLEITDGGSLRIRKAKTLRSAKTPVSEPEPEPAEKAEVDYGALEILAQNSVRPET